jgi:hypothetical protein
MTSLWLVHEGAPEEVTHGLGGELRVPLVHCQLPPVTAAHLLQFRA